MPGNVRLRRVAHRATKVPARQEVRLWMLPIGRPIIEGAV